MPDRYHIHVVPTPGRFQRIGKYGTADWREDCSRCKNCVKHRCLYDVYRNEGTHNRTPDTPQEPVFECKACMSCVQGCTKGLLSMALNPGFLALGDAYWKPDIIASTWVQSDAGRIPVSGAGYRGRFSGPGFDSMWTDMSEIVRPTRDGIHGREYISTAVDIGSKPLRLNFDEKGELTNPSSLIEIQIPAILDAAPWGDPSEALVKARVTAAEHLHTLAVVPETHLAAIPPAQRRFILPLLDCEDALENTDLLSGMRMIELNDGASIIETAEKLREFNKDVLIAVRVIARHDALKRVLDLHEAGISVIHLSADHHGREVGENGKTRFIRDVLREIHGNLVQRGVRDEVTLIASGGIALAEHMPKALICGADLVGVDIPLLISIGCRVCKNGHHTVCPIGLSQADVSYAAQRMVNLMGAWHSQLIEVLGAMGIREVRRLRGETGRAMFVEDLERDAFKDLARATPEEVKAG
ncbi:MAG TPA: glutamate synthase-related protein [Planctomycetota bacterium]